MPDQSPTQVPGLTDPPEEGWGQIVDAIGLLTPPTRLWSPGPRSGNWLEGATVNLSVTCIDRWLPERADQVAIHWEGEPGDRRTLTYAELHEQVTALTRALVAMGVGVGDRVGLHLGWLPETVVAMLACARIGAIHTVLPAPLPADPLADRLSELDLKVLFTQDGAWRHGSVLPLKARADEAMLATDSIEHTVVVRRTGMDVNWFEGDRWLHDILAASRPGQEPADADPVALPADHPVATVALATRGGRPVSIVHGTGQTLAGAVGVHRALATGGAFWCAGEVSWAVTQFHGIYGPLACGGTAVMYEGTLDVPDHRRVWDIVRRYGVEVLLTRPSVMRTVRGWARELPNLDSLPSLRRVVTAGEPVEPELSAWIKEAFGEADLELGDAWGQLELGGIVRITGLDTDHPLPDCGLDIVDAHGDPVEEGEVGEVVLRRPVAGTMVGVEGDHPEVIDHHWTRHPGLYATGDSAERAPGGEPTYLGRTDEVVSISGQLVSLREVTEVLTEHPFVERAAVTWTKDPELGRTLVAAVTLARGAEQQIPEPQPRSGNDPLDALSVELMNSVREALGGLARPRALIVLDRFGDELGRSDYGRAIASLATTDRMGSPRRVTWEQVLVAAGHPAG
ncbi:acyl-CoA synthetase [Ornithinimicrobium sp. Y1694]|uniref:acyl-CoA synthetase n=1 Tax=Ornithinimicrobium sp. Y1694 TaxID=3418590 RepID=UPI003CFAAF83